MVIGALRPRYFQLNITGDEKKQSIAYKLIPICGVLLFYQG